MTTCSKCKCMVGRHKLKDGMCKDIEVCIENIKLRGQEKNEEYSHEVNMLKSRYFRRSKGDKEVKFERPRKETI